MRVCFVLNQFPELSQTFVLRQVVDMIRRGHDVRVIASSVGSELARDPSLCSDDDWDLLHDRTLYTHMPRKLRARVSTGVRKLVPAALKHPRVVATAIDVRRFGWFAATGSLLLTALPLKNVSERYDAIVAHFGPQGILAQGLREMGILRGPLVTFFHAYDISSAPRMAGRSLYRHLFEHAELNLAISLRGAARLRELGAPQDRIHVHHMGVDTHVFTPTRARRRSSRDTFRVVSVGRLVPKKGFEHGIHAVARAARHGTPIEYVIYGSGPLSAALERLVDRLDARSCVRFAGPLNPAAMPARLREADALLAPSITSRDGDEEGIPMVLMEAMASGVPVIATRSGAIPELVEHGHSGLLVNEGDPHALSEALLRLSSDTGLADRLAEAGRRRVLADFDAQEQGRKLVTLLAELVRSPTMQRTGTRGGPDVPAAGGVQ